MKVFVVNREVTTEECDWLDEPIQEGTLVYEYIGHTYGCISSDGLAVTLEPDTTPFFELPEDSLTSLNETQ